jgi:hypothetical protein
MVREAATLRGQPPRASTSLTAHSPAKLGAPHAHAIPAWHERAVPPPRKHRHRAAPTAPVADNASRFILPDVRGRTALGPQTQRFGRQTSSRYDTPFLSGKTSPSANGILQLGTRFMNTGRHARCFVAGLDLATSDRNGTPPTDWLPPTVSTDRFLATIDESAPRDGATWDTALQKHYHRVRATPTGHSVCNAGRPPRSLAPSALAPQFVTCSPAHS